jgi:hypothetical protein
VIRNYYINSSLYNLNCFPPDTNWPEKEIGQLPPSINEIFNTWHFISNIPSCHCISDIGVYFPLILSVSISNVDLLQDIRQILVPPANMFLQSSFVTGDILAIWTLTVRFLATF